MKHLWNSISLIGHDKLSDPNDLRELTLLNRIVAVAMLNLLSFIPMALYFSLPSVAIIVSAGVLLSAFTFFLNAKGYFIFARIYFLSTAILFVLSIMIFMSGRNGGSQIVFIMLTTLHLVLFRKPKHAFLVFLTIVAIFALASYWVENHFAMLDFLGSYMQKFSFYLNVLSCMALVFAVVLYFRNTAFEHEATITAQKEKISQKNKDITDSINYAKRLQQAILPSKQFVENNLPSSFILYKPKDIVAGDFYWIETVSSGSSSQKTLFAVADCTGHGVPGALVSVVCNNALNRSLREFNLTDPGLLLDKTRELIIEQFEKNGEEVKDGMDISLCCLEINFEEKSEILKLTWAGANNPLWIFGKNGFNEIRPDKQPVGKYIHPKPFTTHSLELEPGDTIYIFSDGYVDQFGGPNRKKFKTSALKELFFSIQEHNMSNQGKIIAEAFETWKNDLEQLDDVCVIGVRV